MKTFIIGHRGAMGTAPENTAISFKKAISMGADGVEFDVHMTQDSKLVVIHDDKLERTTSKNGSIGKLTLAEVKQADAGKNFSEEYSGEKILTLEETLDIVKKCSIINIEIKYGFVVYPGLEEKLLNIIDDYDLSDKVLLSSFNHYSINKIKKIKPEIKCGLLYVAGIYKPWDYAKQTGADAIHPFYKAINKDIVEQCKINQIDVNVYGVNDEKIMTHMLDLKVNSIITDYPDQARELYDRRRLK